MGYLVNNTTDKIYSTSSIDKLAGNSQLKLNFSDIPVGVYTVEFYVPSIGYVRKDVNDQFTVGFPGNFTIAQ